MFSEAVPVSVHQVIERLRTLPVIANFYLAGGTALALHLGHRCSVDLDFFTDDVFDGMKLADSLTNLGGELRTQQEDTLHAMLDEVKCSFFRYPYPRLESFHSFSGINLAAVPDIAAMKVVAIAQRGTKKDFFDLYEILRQHTPQQLKTWVLGKFGERRINCYHVLRSLVFFADADVDPDPISLNETSWPVVKSFFLSLEKELSEKLLC
ncbi:MAG: nucleotidyl transferase AbiEii/AbiGii toxin family protein [Candidatus Ozemobacteraceae bacterium]